MDEKICHFNLNEKKTLSLITLALTNIRGIERRSKASNYDVHASSKGP